MAHSDESITVSDIWGITAPRGDWIVELEVPNDGGVGTLCYAATRIELDVDRKRLRLVAS